VARFGSSPRCPHWPAEVRQDADPGDANSLGCNVGLTGPNGQAFPAALKHDIPETASPSDICLSGAGPHKISP
jgi:hypothetical protein